MLLCSAAGLLFAGMAVVGLIGIMPAASVADKLGRKWTIVPSCVGMAGAILIMASTGVSSLPPQPLLNILLVSIVSLPALSSHMSVADEIC